MKHANPTFAELALAEPLQRAVAEEGYETPTPIQQQAIPALLEGRDLLGVAQTGTGKTAAFSLPVLHHLLKAPASRGKRPIRALVLSPTRELAAQIQDRFQAYAQHTHLRSMVIFGGVKQHSQVRALQSGVDILVATPGRLLDLHGQGYIRFDDVEFFVLDEADRMLDMGFIHDIRKVLAVLPAERQNLLFSATMPPAIVKLTRSFLRDPVRVEVTPESTTVERIEQSVWFCEKADKRRLLAALLAQPEIDRALVFTRTKHGANRLTKQMEKAGFTAAAIHGNKSQNARVRALNGFRDGTIRVLIATDVAARGIDVEGVTHVFNFDLPNEPESYVHRIGRTGRAGRDGVAIAFCDPSEGEYLYAIERITGEPIERVLDHPWHSDEAVPPPPKRSHQGARRGRRKPPVAAPKPAPRPAREAEGDENPERGEGEGQRRRRRRRRKKPAGDGGGQPGQQRPAAKPEGGAAEGEAPKRRRRRRRRGPRPKSPASPEA